ncbi:MAG: UDP-N-acetylglucosamine 2-epimerase (hydrolyzing) [Syntrophus sp. (in: bacteria)]|nr:UDP-N-acetylglucosamine 2-epimerase (hydrolyzing) [Syntrophus sp. (in: bacteria)]
MRKTAVFTSTRAEYGLLKCLIQGIDKSVELQLQLIVSGTHLSADYGMTINEIKADGFKVDESVEMVLSHDTPTGICKSMGLAMIGYGEALIRNSPDILVILGDRYEAFCAAAAAQICRIPVAHIHGGESTEGLIDEAFRHSITKMSHLHFASCEVYRQRIIQLGEAPDRVFNVGALGVENIRRMSFMEHGELAESIGFSLEKPYFLVTFHPVTLEKATSGEQFQCLLDALDFFPEFNVILTKTNADTDSRVINHMIEAFARERPGRCLAVASLGANRYLAAMKYAAAVIGNSSSGIVEAPCFRIPTVNIGDRQKGRIRAGNTLNCSPDTVSIRRSIDISLSPAFRESLSDISNPYERPDTHSRIVRLIENTDIVGITTKTFHNIKFS